MKTIDFIFILFKNKAKKSNKMRVSSEPQRHSNQTGSMFGFKFGVDD